MDYFDTALSSLVADRQPLLVLDAGSGGGLVSNALAQRGHNLSVPKTGFDAFGILAFGPDIFWKCFGFFRLNPELLRLCLCFWGTEATTLLASTNPSAL